MDSKDIENKVDSIYEKMGVYNQNVDDLSIEVKKIHNLCFEKYDINDEKKSNTRYLKKIEEYIENNSEDDLKELNESTSRIFEQTLEIMKGLELESGLINEESEELEEKFKVPSLRFHEIERLPFKKMENLINKKKQKLLDKKITVELVEDLDLLPGTSDKYFIKISKNDGNYIVLDMIKYQSNIYDFSVDEEEYVKQQIIKLNGVYDSETTEIAKLITDYISYALAYKEAFTYKYKFIGWDSIERQNGIPIKVFKYDSIFSNAQIKLNGFCGEDWAASLINSSSDENKRLWNKAYAITFNDSVKNSLVLSAAVSGIVRQLACDDNDTNINLNIVGKAGSGKTTLERLVLSFFGEPAKLMGTFQDTDSAMEEIRASRVVLPYVVDDRLLGIDAQNDKNKAKELFLVIFKQANMTVKKRFGAQFKNSDQNIYGAIISSSVEEMLDTIISVYGDKDLGQYRRFIELIYEDEESIFQHGDNQVKFVNSCANVQGYGVEQLISFIFETAEYSKFFNYILDKSCSVEKAFEIFDLVKRNVNNELTSDEKVILQLRVLSLTDNIPEEIDRMTDVIEACEDFDDSIFKRLFSECRKEVTEQIEYFDSENYEADSLREGDISRIMSSSVSRFALLKLTAILLNNSIYNSDTSENDGFDRLEIDVDQMVEVLIQNLHDKFKKAGCLVNTEIEFNKITEEKKQEENVIISNFIKVYDLVMNNRDSEALWEMPLKENLIEEKFILGYYEKSGNLVVYMPKITSGSDRKITFEHILNNVDKSIEELLQFEYGEALLKNNGVTEANMKVLEKKGLLYREKTKTAKNQFSNKKLVRGTEYTFITAKIEEYRNILQSQEV